MTYCPGLNIYHKLCEVQRVGDDNENKLDKEKDNCHIFDARQFEILLHSILNFLVKFFRGAQLQDHCACLNAIDFCLLFFLLY